jgi:hypothetical protein
MQTYGPEICCDQNICGFCEPKTILTKEEEMVLIQMREIRNQAAPIMDRLHDLQAEMSKESSSPEMRELSAQLDILRDHWRGWQKRLDLAIEKKLIALGHKFPVS